jgi:hypothetical protein
MAHDVAGGAFPELEAWCMARGLAFVRWRAACPGAWAARRVVYPGNDEPCCYVVGEEGEILIDAATVEDLGSIQAVGAYFAAAAFEAPPLVIVDPPGPGG